MEVKILGTKLNIDVTPDNKALVFLGVGVSTAALLAGAWGNFQKVQIYKVDTGLKNPPSYNVIVREFDRYEPKFKTDKVELVAYINHTATWFKIIAALTGTVAATMTLVLIEKMIEDKAANGYLKETRKVLQKSKIDATGAVEAERINQQSLMETTSLVEELMQDKRYQEMVGQRQKHELGEDYEDDNVSDNHSASESSNNSLGFDQDAWNALMSEEIDDDDENESEVEQSINDTTTKISEPTSRPVPTAPTEIQSSETQLQSDLISLEQYYQIKVDVKNGVPVAKAIFLATGIQRNDPRLRAYVQEIARMNREIHQ